MTSQIRAIRFVAIGLIVLVGATFAVVRMFRPMDSFEARLAKVVACMDVHDAIPCARPLILSMLNEKSAIEVTAGLSTHLSALRCHYVTHLVGQELYRRSKDVEQSLAQCDRQCDSACIHGVIGEAFAEELGFDDPTEDQQLDLEHLSKEELVSVGSKLCKNGQTCHGVGHALFQATKNLAAAMSSCNDIRSGDLAAPCFNGAAMEYSDMLASRSSRDVSSITFPTVDSLSTLCNLPLLEQRRACFRYFPRTAIETFTANGSTQKEAFAKIREICRGMSGDNRTACFFGYGRFNSYLITTDQSVAHSWCTALKNDRDEAACYFGEVSTAVRDRQEELTNYCGTLRNEPLRAGCYSLIAYGMDINRDPAADLLKYCKKDDTVCTQNIQHFTTDPFEYLKKHFQQ